MLHNIKELYGHKLAASDGDIGHVQDFYFDDQTWVIRYLVADTGSWLTGRQVLVTPHAFGEWDRQEKTLQVKLSKKQIENSPSIDTHQPVSRQYEEEYYRYYGWPTYWNGDAMWGPGGYPLANPTAPVQGGVLPKHHHRAEKHLRSAHAVTGYQIQTAEGAIGTVSGFMVDDRSWAIGELAVDAGHWYAGKEVLIPTGKVERISYEDSAVFVSLTKADIQHTAEHHVAKSGA
ncbi:MAG: PRC-barrel domain-containing protein [Lacunisphaera sp.]|nr:PRC-barrel domain-containing protein [Lacunisphaera sp.]